MVSEEIEEAYIVKGCEKAKYSIVFDPLDGSSNIDAGISTGSIFGIYREPEDGCLVDLKDDGTVSGNAVR